MGEYEAEYSALLERVVDRSGLQAIKLLHSQLDDDNDGTIEPAETGDFIKADLKVGHGRVNVDIEALICDPERKFNQDCNQSSFKKEIGYHSVCLVCLLIPPKRLTLRS